MKPVFLNRIPPRVRKWLLWGVAVFVVYTLAGFFLLPPLIKWQLTKRLPDITKRQAAVRQVKFNPLALSLTVRGLALTEPDARPFASWEEFYVNFQASSLFRWAWTFREIRLVKPFGEVILLEDGKLNFANMLEAPTNAPPANAPPQQEGGSVPRMNIFQLQITNGFVAVEDRTRRSVFRTEYRPINLHLKEFTTRPDTDTPYSFHAESDAGRSVAWAGDLTVQPLRSAGHIEITGVQLARYQPYLADFTSASLTNGLADVQLNYHFSADTNGVDLLLSNSTLRLAQLQILDPATHETVAALTGLDVEQVGLDLRSRTVRLGAVKVSEAALIARLKADGRLNLLELVTLPGEPEAGATNASPVDLPAPAGASPPWAIAVDNFTIERAALSFEDLSRGAPFKTELKPIEVSLKGFSTQADSDAPYSFSISSEAAETFAGQGTVSINPVRSSGELSVGAVDMKKYQPYADEFLRGKIAGGKVEARIPYRFALDTNSLLAGVTNLAVKVTGFELKMPESGETVVGLPEIGVERVDASLEDRRGRVGLLRSSGGSLLVRRQKDGTMNLLALLAAAPTNAAAAQPSPSKPPEPAETGRTNTQANAPGAWTVNVDEIQLDNYTIKIEDQVPPNPANFLLDQLALNVKGLSTASNTPIAASLSLRLNETGTLATRGTVKIAPLFADLDIALTNLDLKAAQPYVEQSVRLGIASGAFGTTGKIRFQTDDPAAPQLTFAGGLSVTNLLTTDQVLFKEFVRWDDLSVSGIDAALTPDRFKIGEIRLVRPKASLLIGADRRPNLSLILKEGKPATNGAVATAPAPAPAPDAGAGASGKGPPVELGTLTLDQASFAFTDESVQPHVVFGIQELSGTVKGLSSTMTAPAEVDLHGRLDAQSPFAIVGRVHPLAEPMFVDLLITNANTQLAPLTGYMEKYVGHPLNKGRLTTSLRYHVENQELKAENKIDIDQLTLGPRNQSPDASSLPVKLGVALLKDNEGRIALDVPLSGRLDDPEFKIFPIALKVIVNVIVKAAASPFNVLGSLVGGGGEELSFVQFTPGTTNVAEGELDKLGKLAAALEKRPALNLEIDGAIDPVRDRQAIARQKLGDQFKAKRLQELTAKGRAPESVETFQLEPQERDRLLRAAFVEQFSTNIAEIIRTNQARLTSTNQATSAPAPEPDRSLFQRVAGIFGGGPPGASKAERRLGKSDREALGQVTPEFMEELLAETVTVTEEELRQLMTDRARWVQDWFVQQGKVVADRLFLVAPKPIDPTYQGESRVNLSPN